MSWTVPITFVSDMPLTAAHLNAALRDNMNETAPAKASTTSGYFTSDGPNQLSEKVLERKIVLDEFSTDAFTYVSAPDAGVDVTHSGTILAMWTTRLYVNDNEILTSSASVSTEVVGKVAASDAWALQHPGGKADLFRAGSFKLFTGLTAGTDTVRLMFKARDPGAAGGLAEYHQSELIVWPF